MFSPGICKIPIDLGFVVDTSGSISKKQYELEKTFIKRIVEKAGLSYKYGHAGIILFSSNSYVAIKFSDFYNNKDFNKAVDNLKAEGSITRIDKGLKVAYDKLYVSSAGARNTAAKILFLVTDGQQTVRKDFVPPKFAAVPLRAAGIKIIGIGIGAGANRKELETIVGNKEDVFLAHNFRDLVSESFMSKAFGTCRTG